MADQKPSLTVDFAALAKAARPTDPYVRPGNGVTAGPNPFTDLLKETHKSGEWRELPLPKTIDGKPVGDKTVAKLATQVEARIRAAAVALGIGANVSKPIKLDTGEWVLKVRGKDRTKREAKPKDETTESVPANLDR